MKKDNKFKFQPYKESGPFPFEVIVTPEMEKILREELCLEIELMQGERTDMGDGMTQIKMMLTDEAKIEAVRLFMVHLMNYNQPPNHNN